MADGHFDPNAVSKRCGAAVIVKALTGLILGAALVCAEIRGRCRPPKGGRNETRAK